MHNNLGVNLLIMFLHMSQSSLGGKQKESLASDYLIPPLMHTANTLSISLHFLRAALVESVGCVPTIDFVCFRMLFPAELQLAQRIIEKGGEGEKKMYDKERERGCLRVWKGLRGLMNGSHILHCGGTNWFYIICLPIGLCSFAE